MNAPTSAALLASSRHALLVGTKKGAWVLGSDDRHTWTAGTPWFFGQEVFHLVADPRAPRTLVAALKTGHLGPTVFRSTDGGETWAEASRPPKFPQPEGGAGGDVGAPATNGREPRTVKTVIWLTPGHPSQPGMWLAGVCPHAMFRSDDGGDTWEPVAGFNDHPMFRDEKTKDLFGEVPDLGATTHSIRIDPRDAAHWYVGLSTGGVFETRDAGATWAPLNAGCEANFLPDPDPVLGQDPHLMRLAPSNPDRLWQQNHCGIYRMDRAEARWHRVGRNLPEEIGDIGFGIVVHPRDPDTAWVFPMDGTEVWPRTSPGGRPAVWRTRDAGATWERQAHGFPEQGWWTVFRQALAADAGDPVGLALGTTSGEVWTSADEGATWSSVAAHLPRVLSVVVAGCEP